MRVFISYHSPDRGTAERLAAALQAQGDGIEVFFDQWTLRPGAFWTPALAEGLADADAILLLLGRNSPGNWQTLEYYEALDRKARQPDFPVVPVVLGDAQPRLPFLGQLHWLQADDPTAGPALAALLPALRGEPLPRPEAPWRTRHPYRGLEAFAEADAEFFFGRDAFTGEILEHLRQGRRGLMLIGNSGVGKSSLVQAGVIAALRRQHWPGAPGRPWPPNLRDSRAWLFVTMRPSNCPLYELARAFASQWAEPTAPERAEQAQEWADKLADRFSLPDIARATVDQLAERAGMAPPRRLVLVVDQAEELYTRAPTDQARRFSTLLAEAMQQPELLVLASLRADYYGHFQADEALFRAAQRVDVPPLHQDGLCAVIRCPAERLGATFEDFEDGPMVPRLAAEADGEPGALPLLSFLLDAMWQRMRKRGDGVLRWADYAALGGVRGALARRAEAYVETCPADQQHTLRRLFTLRLAQVPMEGEAVRRRARRDECSAAEWAIAEDLVGPDWRLLVTGDEGGQPTAEVAHEVLLRRWDRLTGWLKEQHAFLAWKGQLEHARKSWQEGGRKPGDLLQGLPLERALKWLKERREDLAAAECRFIEASRTLRTRRQRRVTMLSLAATAVLAVFLVAALWARSEAEHQRTEAVIQSQAADAANTQAQARRDEALRTQSHFLADLSRQQTEAGDATTGILLALAGLPSDMGNGDRPYVADAEHALYAAVQAQREKRILRGHTDRVRSAGFSPDGQRVVTASGDNTARLWDAASGREWAVLRGHTDTVISAGFSPDGQHVVTTSTDGTARLWDAASGHEWAVLRGHTNGVFSAGFSPDGQRVITASDDKTARLWDAASGRERAVLHGHEGSVFSVGFSPDGQRVVTASEDHTARLWDAASGRESAVLRGHERSVFSAGFSPDGQRVVTASGDNTARLWDAASGHEQAVLRGHTGTVISAGFSPDGQRVVTASLDNTARLWDAASGRERAALHGHTDRVFSARFSPDGQHVVTASADGTARLWDAASGDERAVLRGHTNGVFSAGFSPDGQRVVTASEDHTARLWDAASGHERAVLRGHTDRVLSARFSPDRQRVVTASDDKTARLWDAVSGHEQAVLRGHERSVFSAGFSPDGQRVVTASEDHTARLWDAASGHLRAVLRGHERPVLSAGFSPDGQHVVTASEDKTARLWDAGSGQEQAVLRGHEGLVYSAAFSPDGQRVVTVSGDNTARLWNTANGHERVVLHGYRDWITSAAFSPDGQRVITGSGDNTVQLWDAVSGRELAVLHGHTGWVLSAGFSPDGQRVVTASADGTARLWDAASGHLRAVLRGHTDRVLSARFSPDGQRVVTASDDKTARLWDAVSGHEQAVLRGHTERVISAGFSPDGQCIVTASEDHTARLWRVFATTQELIDYARSIVPRELTPDQRRQFFLE